MNGVKKLACGVVCAAVALHAANVLAGTYTWTGNGNDGLWFTAGNWDYNGAAAATSPGRTPSDDVVIDGAGVTVSYVPGGDWTPTGSTTISGGATLTQISKDNWATVKGAILLDGGFYDTGSASRFQLGETMTVRNGGVFTLRWPCSPVNLDGNGLIVIEDGGMVTHNNSFWGGSIPVEFRGGEMTIESHYKSNAADVYEGGAITAAGEFCPLDGLVVTGTVITCSLYSPKSSDIVVSFVGGGLVCTRQNYNGFYQEAGVYINIPSNSTATFTMPVKCTSVYSSYFAGATPKFRFAGETVNATDFEDIFTVEGIDVLHSRFFLTPPSDWKIGVSDVSSSSATVSATMKSVGIDDYSVYVACGTEAITAENILSKGESVAGSEGVYSRTFDALADMTLYNYGFAIVTNGVVASFLSAKFFASDFDCVYLDGAWLGRDPGDLNTSASVLILDDFSNALADIQVAHTVVSNAAITSTGALSGTGGGTMQVYSSQITNSKLNDVGAVCGTYAGSTFMNFVSLSGNGVIYPACSYTFNATEEWKNDAYNLLFVDNGKGRIRLNGEKVDEATYAASFTLTEGPATGSATTPYNLTLTYWEPFPAGGSATDWTLLSGARTRLVADERAGNVSIPADADVKIDLCGHTLRVKSLTVGGVRKTGEFTAQTLPSLLVGEGSLVADAPGLTIYIR